MLKLSQRVQSLQTQTPGIPNSVVPRSIITPQKQLEAPLFNLQAAVGYNIRSEKFFKEHEPEIKTVIGTVADWKSPEFAKAVYDWQKANGFTGKWVDGKFGSKTMAKVSEFNPILAVKPISNAKTTLADLVAPDGTVKLRLTGYWPFTARPEERKMEGGHFDRKMPDNPTPKQYKAHILHTVEEHLADPAKTPFVSLSGDDAIWPYGQKVIIPWVGGKIVIGRVVDTGSHFRGAGKKIREEGYEPIDICVNSSRTVVPRLVVAQVPGIFQNTMFIANQEPMSEEANIVYKRVKNAKIAARAIILGGLVDE